MDLETRGVRPYLPDNFIVGIGLANAEHCFYIHLAGASDEVCRYIRNWLKTVRLVAYNVMFDGAFLRAWCGEWLNWEGCAYAMFKCLTLDGWAGQTWSLEVGQMDVLGWPRSNKRDMTAALKEQGLTKADMWQLPAEILGPYCASDADAAWQLWEYFSQLCQSPPYDRWMDYHKRCFMTRTELLAEVMFRGIKIDQERIESCRSTLEQSIVDALYAFQSHPEVAVHLEQYNAAVRDAWLRSAPPQLTAAGKQSARWEAWRDREKRWMKDKGFNPNSKQQLEWLFYDKMGYKPKHRTETGRRAVDKKVLPSLGEPGRMLNKYNLLVKRRGYVEAVIEKSARDGTVHPHFNSLGTVTTRLGGSDGLNLQQLHKDPDYLWSWVARPGMKLVQLDFASLEPTILAEFSRDPTMWAVYGPNAKPNDIYLYCLAKSSLGKELRAQYDPDNPTPEGLAYGKKHFKGLRGVFKVVRLAKTYGAGVQKIYDTLMLSGHKLPYREVEKICREQDQLFAGVKKFEQQLLDMWHSSGGWFPSIFGTPVAMDRSYLKDIINKFCQLSGSQVLQLYLYYVNKLRVERGVEMYPWIPDLHDETIFEVPEDQTVAAAQILRDALVLLNAELQTEIPFKGEPEVIDNLAAVKCENYKQFIQNKGDESC